MQTWNDETAIWYAEKYGNYPTNRLAVEALQVPANACVVDIGWGTGSALRHLASKAPGAKLIGIDPVPKMLEIARAETQNDTGGARIQFLSGSAARLPVADEIADLVLAFDSYDHWQDKEAGLSEVRRILQPTGTFVVVKDGGLPGGTKAKTAFTTALSNAGFLISAEKQITEKDVSFTMWVCRAKDE